MLAGGKGTRLGNLTKDKPKALLEVGGRPIMDYIINALVHTKQIHRIIIHVPAKYANNFATRYGNGTDTVKIEYITSSAEDTAKALQYDIGSLQEDSFMLLMGDIVFDTDLDAVINYYKLYKERYNVLLTSLYSEENIVYETKNKFAADFRKKKLDAFVAGGIYIFNKSDINGKMIEYFDSVLPNLANNRKLIAYKFFGYIKGINTPEELNEVDLDLKSGKVYLSGIEDFLRPSRE